MADDIKRVILVTGSNSGLGFELVRLLAELGHVVYLASRNVIAAKDAQATLKREYKLDVKFVLLDVSDASSIHAAAKVVEENEGRLDVLVNNAGVVDSSELSGATTITTKAMRDVLEINLFGTVETTLAFLPLIRKTNRGKSSIVNVSSSLGSNTLQATRETHAGSRPAGSHAVGYKVSKAALNAYTIQLAHQLKQEGIPVTAVNPGMARTRMLTTVDPDVGKPPREGAKVILPLALLGAEDIDKTGTFSGENGTLPW